MLRIDQVSEYVVKVQGYIDSGLLDSVPVQVAGLAAGGETAVTTLSGIFTDQAGLVGLIRRLHALGVVILVVERVAPGGEPAGATGR